MGKVGVLVVTHGRLAEELVEATRTIVGQVGDIEAVSIDWDDQMSDARRQIEEAVSRVGRGGSVLVLTDMFGGTPTNLALSLLEPGKVEVITGVNLPMLLKLTNLREEASFEDTVRRVAEQGRGAIQVASGLLQSGGGSEPAGGGTS